MRRLLTTLVILLVVIIAGMTSLVFLINPNDFRQYMVERVEVKSGYKLAINGSLRWHVWPQLSIIAGKTSLTAPGAKNRWSVLKICDWMSNSGLSFLISSPLSRFCSKMRLSG